MKAVVLGGGVAGVFIGYFLKRAGFEVVGIGGEVEYPLTSLVVTLSIPHESDIELAKRSLEIYREFVSVREVLSIDILPRWVDLTPLSSIQYEVVDSFEGVRTTPDEIIVVSKDYLVPVRKLVKSLRRELGFREDYGVLKLRDGKAYVVVKGSRVEGDIVVLAAGYRNSQLAEEAGLWLPLRPYECYAVLYIAPRRLWSLSIGDYVLGWYGRPATPPFYIAGNGCGNYGSGVPSGYVKKITNLIKERVSFVYPLYVKSGRCEMGPHGGPVYGRHPDVENLYILGGLDGYGSMLGPALAERLTSLITGVEIEDEYRIENFTQRQFDPCTVAERHNWGAYKLRNV
ncbi:MAG: FAD-binding oxidoreductase [Pyrobaculum sp.]